MSNARRRSASRFDSPASRHGRLRGLLRLAACLPPRHDLATSLFSFATGPFSFATGLFSFATGLFSFATGPFSFATGLFSFATGLFSFATGLFSFATGPFSFATGLFSFATGLFSFATGRSARANQRSARANCRFGTCDLRRITALLPRRLLGAAVRRSAPPCCVDHDWRDARYAYICRRASASCCTASMTPASR